MPSKSKSDNLDDLFNDAVADHQASRLAVAEAKYRKILDADPTHAGGLHFLGVLAHQAGQPEVAVDLIERALEKAPEDVEARSNFGNALIAVGRIAEALEAYEAAVAEDPDYVEARINLGNALQSQARHVEAVACYREALKRRPDFAPTHNNLAGALLALGRIGEAVDAARTAISHAPEYAEAHNLLSKALLAAGERSGGAEAGRRATELRPTFADAHASLGIALMAVGNRDAAIKSFERAFKLKRGPEPVNPDHESFRYTTQAKLRHDIEQFRYLAQTYETLANLAAVADDYEGILEGIGDIVGETQPLELTLEQRQLIGTNYNCNIYMAEVPTIFGSSLNYDLDVDKITADYLAHNPGMTFFDNLLTDETLAELRRFCLESTVWADFNHAGGYMGAYLIDGFVCPLLLQVADDLRHLFPDIFKDYHLTQLWGYKYDNRLTGIGMHADFAAVNFNFWVTPDEANLDPKSGGLIVYDVKAPLDWQFQSYNKDEAAMQAYIDAHSENKMMVPHRQNRAVMFDSDLFHASDAIRFKGGYENRRINITMLFGDRRSN